MKKTAVTALMSLKVVCKSCTVGQSKGLKVWWVVKNFDLNWRTVSNNTEWKSWLLSGKFCLICHDLLLLKCTQMIF